MKESLIDVEQGYIPAVPQLSYSDLPDEIRIKLKSLTTGQVWEALEILNDQKLSYAMEYETERFLELIKKYNTIDVKPYVAKRLKYKRYNDWLDIVVFIFAVLLFISLMFCVTFGVISSISSKRTNMSIAALFISIIVAIISMSVLWCLNPKGCLTFWKKAPSCIYNGLKYILTQMCCDLGSAIYFCCSYKIDPIEEL